MATYKTVKSILLTSGKVVSHKLPLCDLCQQPILFEIWMVKDKTWAMSGLKRNDGAHLECFLKALPRKIRVDDFTDARCNQLFWVGVEAAKRG